jgi:hypothetical protein
MSSFRNGLLAALVVACWASVAENCQADGHGWGFGYGWRSIYQTQELENVPYFSLYPPVYYSYPVARTYGYSPWAYPPGTVTPEAPPAPKTIENPYVPEKSKAKPKAKPATDKSAGPRTIINPHLGKPRLTAFSR